MELSRVDLKLDLKTETEELFASAFLTIKNPDNTIEFELNSKLEILEVTTEVKWKRIELDLEEYQISEDCFLKNCRSCSINLPESLHDLSELNLTVRYKGSIEGDEWGTNYLEKERVELGIYAVYYPLLNLDDKISFSLILQSPEEWDWIVNADRLEDCKCNIWETDDSRLDIYIVGNPRNQSIRENESSRFRGSRRKFNIFKDLNEDLNVFEKLLVEVLGKPPTENFYIVLAPRESGGTISRQGLISMQDTLDPEILKNNKEGLLMGWIHEMCHFWFNSTSIVTFDNWIDEGLCDYCALFIAKKHYGEKFYSDRIEEVKVKLREEENLPAIKDITRLHPKANILFYKYGALIFHDIMFKIGEDLFSKLILNFAQKSLKKPTITTMDLVDSLVKLLKKNGVSI